MFLAAGLGKSKHGMRRNTIRIGAAGAAAATVAGQTEYSTRRLCQVRDRMARGLFRQREACFLEHSRLNPQSFAGWRARRRSTKGRVRVVKRGEKG